MMHQLQVFTERICQSILDTSYIYARHAFFAHLSFQTHDPTQPTKNTNFRPIPDPTQPNPTQPAGQPNPRTTLHKLGGRLPLLSARPAVTSPAAEHHRPFAGTKLCCLVTEARVCVNNLSRVALGSTTAGQWLKWFCEAGGGGSPDEAKLEQTPYPFQPH